MEEKEKVGNLGPVILIFYCDQLICLQVYFEKWLKLEFKSNKTNC